MDFIRAEGEVQVESLAESFDVTPQTIRRDLNQLFRLRLLQRVHGGAIIQDGVENLGYRARQRVNAKEKAAIGKRAADLIPNDSSLFINIGTTTEQVAGYLHTHVGLLVITNNINVANALTAGTMIETMIAGGAIRREDGGIVGGSTEDFIAQFKVDFAVIGGSAINLDGAILDFDQREVRVAQAIIRNSRRVILVADAMKFERNAPIRIADMKEIDYLVTDEPPPEALMRVCLENRVQVEVAAPAGDV